MVQGDGGRERGNSKITQFRGDATRSRRELANFPYTWLLRCTGRGIARGAPTFDGMRHKCAADPPVASLGPFRRKRPHKAEVRNNLQDGSMEVKISAKSI